MKNSGSEKVCPAVKMLSFVGERHMLTIIYNLISKPMGFNDIQDKLEINTATLAKRLSQLEEERLVEKVICPSDSRRHYYSLTKRGKKLSKLLEKLSNI
jgi:DNA-binding HxlR family transcriptional regulator